MAVKSEFPRLYRFGDPLSFRSQIFASQKRSEQIIFNQLDLLYWWYDSFDVQEYDRDDTEENQKLFTNLSGKLLLHPSKFMLENFYPGKDASDSVPSAFEICDT